jgi:3-hydroxyacyl-[acyl-carrier-protein] dehydratase
MRPAPFVARWQAGPVVAGAFEGRLRLADESLFAGHYPGAPILPGSFLIEALLQAAGTVLGEDLRLEEIVACRFHSPLLPGDEVVARFTVQDAGAGVTRVEVTASGRQLAAQLTLLVGPAAGTRHDTVVPEGCWVPAGAAARALDASFILGALPHRPPALLVDSAAVVDVPEGGPALLARKAVTRGERCYAGADGSPNWNYPPTLIVESFCQACGLLRVSQTPAGESSPEHQVRVVAKLAGCRFTGAAVPGDLLEHHVRLVARTPHGAVFSGQTAVAGRLVLQVERVVAAAAGR